MRSVGVDDETKIKASKRAFEILVSIVEEHDELYLSLAATALHLDKGHQHVVQAVAEQTEKWKQMTSEEVAGMACFLTTNPFVALARVSPFEAVEKVTHQVAISSLIVAHAFFEKVLKDLLRLTIICDRPRWLSYVTKQKLELSDIKAKGLEACEDELFESNLRSLGLAGMDSLLGRVLSFCKGDVSTSTFYPKYRFDRDRFKALDELRHQYAHHRSKKQYTIKQAGLDIFYFSYSGVHLLTCLMKALDIEGASIDLAKSMIKDDASEA
jgi:hypothetical protein